MLRGRRAHPPEAVRGRGRDATSERVEQGLCEGMIGDADADRVAATRRFARDAITAPADDERERTGPAGFGERVRDLGHVTPEVVELRGARDVHDDGMINRALLDCEQAT